MGIEHVDKKKVSNYVKKNPHEIIMGLSSSKHSQENCTLLR